MIWRISDVNEGNQYKLQLCQSNDGDRFFRLTEMGTELDIYPPRDVVFVTALVPIHLLLKRSLKAIAASVLLGNGQPFFVDAHGMWLTESEMQQMNAGVNFNEIRWATDQAPEFAPK